MKKFILCLSLLTGIFLAQGQSFSLVGFKDTTIDLKGRVISSVIPYNNLKNVRLVNFKLTGAAKFTPAAGSGTVDGLYIANFTAEKLNGHLWESKTNDGWGSGPTVTGLEMACFTVDGAAGYVIRLSSNIVNPYLHHFKIVNTTQGGDGQHPGPVFFDGSFGRLDRFWVQECYGGFRFFGGGTCRVTNGVVVDGRNYSAVEYNAKEVPAMAFALYVDNCVFGNLRAATYETSGLVTWDSKPGSIRSFTNSKVFNTSTGKAWTGDAPTATAGTQYYATVQAAGYVNVASIKLPDGSAWDAGGCAGPTPPIPPVTVKIDSVLTVTVTRSTVFYTDGTKKTRSDSLTVKQ